MLQTIRSGRAQLEGDLEIPSKPAGLKVFAHGSGSSRKSPRNMFVAQELQRAGFGTLLFDLLTADEDLSRATRFDIDLLTKRLFDAVKWVESSRFAAVPIGLFGASTGAAAGLRVATMPGSAIFAVVSRGGRTDLVGEYLPNVTSPSLFIVGSKDPDVLEINRSSMSRMPSSANKKLEVVQGASPLFEEPGALEEVARLTCAWFAAYAKS